MLEGFGLESKDDYIVGEYDFSDPHFTMFEQILEGQSCYNNADDEIEDHSGEVFGCIYIDGDGNGFGYIVARNFNDQMFRI